MEGGMESEGLGSRGRRRYPSQKTLGSNDEDP